jgi:hypothetical protein
MAIARNSSADLGLQIGVTSLTAAYTCGSGSDRYLLVACFTGNTDDVTGVTYNAVAMTRIATAAQSGVDRRVYLYGLAAPASGSNNVVISMSASNAIQAFAADYTGMSSTQPDDTDTNTSVGTTSLSVTPVVVASNCWVVGVARDANGSAISWTNATGLQAASGLYLADTNGTVGTGSYTVTASNAGADLKAMIGASFAPAGGGGGGITAPSRFMLLGSR